MEGLGIRESKEDRKAEAEKAWQEDAMRQVEANRKMPVDDFIRACGLSPEGLQEATRAMLERAKTSGPELQRRLEEAGVA